MKRTSPTTNGQPAAAGERAVEPGRPTATAKELAALRRTLLTMALRVKKIEHDCSLIAMKIEGDRNFRELFARVAELEDDDGK